MLTTSNTIATNQYKNNQVDQLYVKEFLCPMTGDVAEAIDEVKDHFKDHLKEKSLSSTTTKQIKQLNKNSKVLLTTLDKNSMNCEKISELEEKVDKINQLMNRGYDKRYFIGSSDHVNALSIKKRKLSTVSKSDQVSNFADSGEQMVKTLQQQVKDVYSSSKGKDINSDDYDDGFFMSDLSDVANQINRIARMNDITKSAMKKVASFKKAGTSFIKLARGSKVNCDDIDDFEEKLGLI